jgi:hypothetical protein
MATTPPNVESVWAILSTAPTVESESPPLCLDRQSKWPRATARWLILVHYECQAVLDSRFWIEMFESAILLYLLDRDVRLVTESRLHHANRG